MKTNGGTPESEKKEMGSMTNLRTQDCRGTMELIDTKYRIRCEMGACKNFAAKTIKLSRVGIRSQIHICENCLCELYAAIGEGIVPKSIETAKSKKK